METLAISERSELREKYGLVTMGLEELVGRL
jgi:hypothetical protein